MDNVDYLTFVAEGIHRRGLAVPAVFLLESSKPLCGLGQQLLSSFRPMFACIVGARHVDAVLSLLEKEDAIEALISRLEQMQASGAKG